MSILAELVPLSALLSFPAAWLLWRLLTPSQRSRLSQKRRPSYARFNAHRQLGQPSPSLDAELVVGWPGDFRICAPCGETRYVEVRDDSVRCFEHGHVTPKPA